MLLVCSYIMKLIRSFISLVKNVIKLCILCHVITGTAVVIVMLVTTLLMILVMLLIWRCHWILVLIFTGLSLVVEGTDFSPVLCKVNQGGWVPLVIALAFCLSSCKCCNMVPRNDMSLRCTVRFQWHGFLGLVPA